MIGIQNRSVLWLVEKLFEKRMWLVSMVLTHIISRKPHNSFLCLLLCLTLVKSSNSWVVITHAILCEETTEKKHSSTLWWLNRVSVSLSNFFFFVSFRGRSLKIVVRNKGWLSFTVCGFIELKTTWSHDREILNCVSLPTPWESCRSSATYDLWLKAEAWSLNFKV